MKYMKSMMEKSGKQNYKIFLVGMKDKGAQYFDRGNSQ
jgi:hypothetical protein